MALNYNNLKSNSTDKERLAMAWEVMEQTMTGQTVNQDQINAAQWVIHQLSPRYYDDCVPAVMNSPQASGSNTKKKKRKKKSG